MAVLYKLYQDNRDTSSHKGEWYARAKTLDTVTLRVKIDGLGSFKMSLKTSPAPTAKEFSASKNIKSMRALFQEDVTVDKNGMRHRSLSSGATAKELPKNAVGEEVEP